MKSTNLHKISPNGRYLAIVTPDGCLKIWETATKVQKLEYTPASHLVSPITALAWVPLAATKKSNQLAFGTASGRVMLYSLKEGELKSSLPQEHQAAVTGLAWDLDGSGLYSASEDKQVVHWDLAEESVVARWNGGVCGLAVVPDPLRLVAAQPHGLTLWSLPDHTALRSLDGHTQAVVQCAALTPSIVVSAAQHDRTLCCWDLEREASIPAASLRLTGQPMGFSQQLLTSQDAQYLQLAVWTVAGTLNVFHCKAHFKKNKPIFPKTEITVFCKGKVSEILPVLAAHVYPDGSILVAYGSYLHPVFEKLTPDLDQKKCYLMREVEKPRLHLGNSQKDLSSNPSIGTTTKIKVGTYKKDKPLLPDNLSDSPYDLEARRLIEGLQNMDLERLDEILNYREEAIIEALVDRLTTDHLIPIFTFLTENYNYHRNYVCWVRCLYLKFAYYMMTEVVPHRLVELLEDMGEIHERTPRPSPIIDSLDDLLDNDAEDLPKPFYVSNPEVQVQRDYFENLDLYLSKRTIKEEIKKEEEPKKKKRKI